MLATTDSSRSLPYTLEVPDVGSALLAGAHPADVLDVDLTTPAGCSAAWNELEEALATVADPLDPHVWRAAQAARHTLERVEDAVTAYWTGVRIAQETAQRAAAASAEAHLRAEAWDAERARRLAAPFEYRLFDDSRGIETQLRGTWLSIPLYNTVRYGCRFRQLFCPSIRMRIHPDDPGRIQGEDGSSWAYAQGFSRGASLRWQPAILRPAAPRAGRPTVVSPSLPVLPDEGKTVEVVFHQYDRRLVFFSRVAGAPHPPGCWVLPINRT